MTGNCVTFLIGLNITWILLDAIINIFIALPIPAFMLIFQTQKLYNECKSVIRHINEFPNVAARIAKVKNVWA